MFLILSYSWLQYFCIVFHLYGGKVFDSSASPLMDSGVFLLLSPHTHQPKKVVKIETLKVHLVQPLSSTQSLRYCLHSFWPQQFLLSCWLINVKIFFLPILATLFPVRNVRGPGIVHSPPSAGNGSLDCPLSLPVTQPSCCSVMLTLT